MMPNFGVATFPTRSMLSYRTAPVSMRRSAKEILFAGLRMGREISAKPKRVSRSTLKFESVDEMPAATSTRSIDSRSEEHTSELQSLMRISYAVFCLKKKKQTTRLHTIFYNYRPPQRTLSTILVQTIHTRQT